MLWLLLIYALLAVISLFLAILIFRLSGDSAEDCYSSENDGFYLFIMVFAPISFIVEIVYILIQLTKKYMIAIIETIVAWKETKDEEDVFDGER